MSSLKEQLMKAGFKPSKKENPEIETIFEGKKEKMKEEKGEKPTNHSLKSAVDSMKCKKCGKVGCTDC